jgi:spore germination protein
MPRVCTTTTSRTGPRRRQLLLAGILTCMAATAALLQPGGTAAAQTHGAADVALQPAASTVVERSVGYLAYWDQARALRSVSNAGDAVTEMSPSWYAPAADGSIVHQEDGRVADSAAEVTSLRASGALVVPALANYRNKQWDRSVIGPVLVDPNLRRKHVDAVRTLVRNRGFDGIDIDYEHLAASDRVPFTAFVTALADALHADGKVLSVTLHPKSWEPGPQPKNQAQDYAAIGRAADEVRIMLYDYHWDTSGPGALAPISWLRQVMGWARTQVPPQKLVLGVATYGYDWVGKRGTSLMWNEIAGRARAQGAQVRYNATVQAPWFTYTDSRGRKHTVWFENARSIAAKKAVMRDLGLGGIHYWRLGGEDPAIWTVS